MSSSLSLSQHPQRFAVILIIGIQISARFLNSDHFINNFLGSGSKFRTIPRLQNKPNSLGPFINIGIREYRPALRSLTLPHQTTEIVHPPVSFQQVVHRWHTLCDVDLASRPPESAVNRDSSDRNVLQLGMRRLGEILHTLIFPVRRVGQLHVALNRRTRSRNSPHGAEW